MDSSVSRRVKTTRSVATNPSPTFRYDYLDIDHWPYGWSRERRDLLVAERLLGIFKAFLFHLLDQGLSRKTLLLHRDHVRTLGEEVIRRVKTQWRRRDMVPVLFVFVDEDGGPVIYPPTSSPQQRSFDSTCLKLRQFLLESNKASM
jgi:hypothetical protein